HRCYLGGRSQPYPSSWHRLCMCTIADIATCKHRDKGVYAPRLSHLCQPIDSSHQQFRRSAFSSFHTLACLVTAILKTPCFGRSAGRHSTWYRVRNSILDYLLNYYRAFTSSFIMGRSAAAQWS